MQGQGLHAGPPIMAQQKDGSTTLPISSRSVMLEQPYFEDPGSPTDAAKLRPNRWCPWANSRLCQEYGFGPLVMQSCAVAVLVFEGVVYNWVYLWKILPAVDKEFLVIPFFILFNTIYGLTIWSYFRAHCSDPGLIPDRWKEFVELVGPALPIVPARLEWQPGRATFCKKCSIARPERAHHCNVCNVCVLRMDHHCPWINNCVGFLNHKFFLMLVGYALLSCTVALLTSLPELIYFMIAIGKVKSSDFWKMPHLEISDILTFLAFGWLLVAFLVILAPMLAQHLHLATINATTIEAHYDNMPNPFDLGTVTKNIEQIFGSLGPDWILPVMPAKPLSDGVTFPRNYERLGDDGYPQAMVREYGQPWVMQEKLWRVRYQVRPAPPLPDGNQDGSLDGLMGLTGCYTPCSVSREVDNVIMLPQQRIGWNA